MFLFEFRPYCLEQSLTYGRLEINIVEWMNLEKKAASCPVLTKHCSSLWMGNRKWTIVHLQQNTTKKSWSKTILTWKPSPALEATTFILTNQRLPSGFTGGCYIASAGKVGEPVTGWNENGEKLWKGHMCIKRRTASPSCFLRIKVTFGTLGVCRLASWKNIPARPRFQLSSVSAGVRCQETTEAKWLLEAFLTVTAS